MPRLFRVVVALALAALALSLTASAAPPPPSQYIGGWAPSAMAGSPLNHYGFTPAPRTPNMVWLSSLIGEPAFNDTHADLAFTGNMAVQAEYQSFRIVDMSNPANPVTLSNTLCAGSQGDVVVAGDILVRGHEGTHNIPNGDLNRVCETGGGEIQTVTLTNFDTDGDSFRLTLNGNNTAPIVRGAAGNFSAAGIQLAIQGRNEIQQVTLTGFVAGTSSYRVRVNGLYTSELLGAGGLPISNANVQAVINAIPGFAGGVTVAGASATTGNFTATFAGNSASTDVPLLEIVSCAPACTGVATTTQTAIPAMPGWTTGGTVAIGALTDAGFTMTFGGLIAANDINPFTVTNGTGGTTGVVVETRKGTPVVSWRGMSIHDISNPRNPLFVKGLAICGSTHTITKYFDDVTNTLYVFGTGGGTNTNQPAFGNTTCSTLPGSRGDVVEIPMDNPRSARLLQNNYVPMGFEDDSCHDSDAFEELHIIAVACSGGGGASLIDVSDFKNPKVLWTYSYPGLQTVHSAAFSWDGRYVYVNGEPGGGSGAECAFDDDTLKPMIHILDTKTGRLVGMWMLPRPQDRVGSENCTTHTINVVPIVGRHLIAYSGYQGGVSVIDVTNPRAGRELAYVDPISPQTGGSGSGCWTGYWYNDNLYCSELDWGLHTFTVSDQWWKQAMTLDELNPQTFTKLIRCDVSVSGAPTRAGQRRRVTVKVNLSGPGPRQAGWGIKARVNGPGIGKTLTTGENGTASAIVRANRRGFLRVSVPAAVNLPTGCSAPAKRIRAKR